MATYTIDERDIELVCTLAAGNDALMPLSIVLGAQGPTLAEDDEVILHTRSASPVIRISTRSTTGWSYSIQFRDRDRPWSPFVPSPVSIEGVAPHARWRARASRGGAQCRSATFELRLEPAEAHAPAPPPFVEQCYIEDRDLDVECLVDEEHRAVIVHALGPIQERSHGRTFDQLGLRKDAEILNEVAKVRMPPPVVHISTTSTPGWSFAFQRNYLPKCHRGRAPSNWGKDERALVVDFTGATVQWRVHANRGDENLYSDPVDIKLTSTTTKEAGPR